MVLIEAWNSAFAVALNESRVPSLRVLSSLASVELEEPSFSEGITIKKKPNFFTLFLIRYWET